MYLFLREVDSSDEDKNTTAGLQTQPDVSQGSGTGTKDTSKTVAPAVSGADVVEAEDATPAVSGGDVGEAEDDAPAVSGGDVGEAEDAAAAKSEVYKKPSSEAPKRIIKKAKHRYPYKNFSDRYVFVLHWC